MKLICPCCGAHGHEGLTKKERRTAASFQFACITRGDDGKNINVHECLTCHQGLTTTRWSGKARPLDPEYWQERRRYIERVDAILAREFNDIVAVQGIGQARRLVYAAVMEDDFELRRALAACAEVDQEQAAIDAMERWWAALEKGELDKAELE